MENPAHHLTSGRPIIKLEWPDDCSADFTPHGRPLPRMLCAMIVIGDNSSPALPAVSAGEMMSEAIADEEGAGEERETLCHVKHE